jgi:glycosyltransferase involved in cell wall biosynthesis
VQEVGPGRRGELARADANRRSAPPLPARPGVLLVGNFLSGSGMSRGVCEDLAIRLREAGWLVRTTSSRPGRARRLLSMLWAVWACRRGYSVCQVDVFSGPAFGWAFAVTTMLRLLRKPFVLTLHGGRLPGFSRQWRHLVRFTLRSARVVTAPSPYLREAMRPYRPDTVLVPNPVDIHAYPYRLRSVPRPFLVWCRSFHRIYNPSLAPEVVALLASEFPDISLVMIGPDRGDGSLDRTSTVAAKCGVAGRLEIAGGIPKSKVGAMLARGDIFLNTSNLDNAPVSLIEAMACGLCIVSTDVGGIPDLLEDGEDAILVPPGNAEAMAAGVRQVLTNPELARRISANARRKAERMDWSVVLPVWERILYAAAKKSDRHSGARTTQG